MARWRLTLAVATTAGLIVVALSTVLLGTPTRALADANSTTSHGPWTAALRHHVRSAGRYRITVTVSTPRSKLRVSRGKVVSLKVGKLSRRVRIGRRGHATLKAKVRLRKGTLTIDVRSRFGTPRIRLKLSRIKRGSSLVTRGATGSSGSVAPATGTVAVSLPAGFAPIASYRTLAKDYVFDGSSLPADWSVGSGSNYGYSSTEYQSSQVSLTGTSVALTASKQTGPDGAPYEGAWISTSGAYSFDYGMIDYRAKMPAGQGLWSGLWAVNPAGTSPHTEIDVQEMLLGNTHDIYGSLHNWGPTPYWTETQSADRTADLSAGFNDYEVIWQPGMITWAVDGVAYAQFTEAQAAAAGEAWPFNAPNGVYLIADLAVGGAGDWGGAPTASTVFPATMQIQSIRVWQ